MSYNHPKSLYAQQSSNNTKTFFLMVTFFVVIVGLGWFLSFYFDSPIILFAMIAISLVMNITSYWYSDKIVLKMANAKEAIRDEYFDLYTSVENLSITAGLPMPKVYVIKDDVPNAFATGRNKENSVVAVSTGLLNILNKTELEGVIAHELAHIENKDILLQTVVVVLVGFVTLVTDYFLRFTMFGGGNGRNKQGNIIMIFIGVVLMILAPIFATLLQLAISRKREFAADATGALLTRYPEGLASALEKIEGHAGVMRNANHAMAHLYIADPFKNKKKKIGFMNKIFRTHPPTYERIAALRGE